MTVKEVYEAVLVELNKVNASSLSIEEYEYYLNKAVLAFANERYNFYAVNQQLTDDLRVLLKTQIVSESDGSPTGAIAWSTGATLTNDNTQYDFTLPTGSEYFHLLGCRAVWNNSKNGVVVKQMVYPVKHLTIDKRNAIERNPYLQPSYERPYYKLTETTSSDNNTPSFQVLTGKAKTGMTLDKIEVDYLKLPESYTASQDDIYSGSDGVIKLEWPDYLKTKLVAMITLYALEQATDERMKSNPQVSQDIPPVPLELSGKH